MEELEITDVGELEMVAKRILEVCKAMVHINACVVALHGDLGAGKTALVKALARELGVHEEVTSPTFVIQKLYALDDSAQKAEPFARFCHIDAYRIQDIDEMRVLRFEELLAEKDTIICIEWAERIKALLPEDTLDVHIDIEGQMRKIRIG